MLKRLCHLSASALLGALLIAACSGEDPETGAVADAFDGPNDASDLPDSGTDAAGVDSATSQDAEDEAFDPDERFGPPPELDADEVVVLDPFIGVRILSVTADEPRPLSYHVALVDPQAPGVSFTTTPGNGEAPRETTRQTTRAFVDEVGAQLGINAHFFTPWPPEDPHADLLGIAFSDGDVVSAFQDTWTVGFAVSELGEAAVVHQDPDDPSGFGTLERMEIDDAVGAREQIVTAGVNTGDWEELHPRTAIGVREDNIVVMLVVDGRQDGESEGMTTPELADLLLRFDVLDAINLDGGGSSTMVVADPDARLVNTPVGYVIPNTERDNGSALAVFATPY